MFQANFSGSLERIRRPFSGLRSLVLGFSVLVVLFAFLTPPVPAQNRNNNNNTDKSAGSEPPSAPKPLPGLTDPAASVAGVDQSTYIIGPNDVLSIEVFREPAWTHLYPVRPDGMITIQLVGEMKASGLTPKQLEKQLTEALKEQVNDPHVTVGVYDVLSKKYNVAGEVKRPGDYPLIRETKVFEAINAAGGFVDTFANKTDISIIRGSQILKFNYKDYVNGKHREKNIVLQNGDTIYVK